MKEILENIAQLHLDIETLDARNSDALDFHELHVSTLRAALLAAFEAGQRRGGLFTPRDLRRFETTLNGKRVKVTIPQD